MKDLSKRKQKFYDDIRERRAKEYKERVEAQKATAVDEAEAAPPKQPRTDAEFAKAKKDFINKIVNRQKGAQQ
jgi:hypothetical protein